MRHPPAEVRRIVYLGTPALAVAPLRALHDAGYEIPLVVTRPDARRGRGAGTSASAVKEAAQQLGIPVTHDVDDALDVNADLGVVVAFGQLIRPHVLERLALVNMHFSLLPRWRGAAPVERALLAGDQTTGVCLMVLAEELDVGDVYARVEVPIGPDATLESLRGELVDAGTALLIATLERGLPEPEPQQGEVVWAHKIRPDELRIDWTTAAEVIARQVRVGHAYTTHEGKRLKVWRVAVGDDIGLQPGEVSGTHVGTGAGTVELIEVQPEGRPRRHADEWARGARLGPASRVGE